MFSSRVPESCLMLWYRNYQSQQLRVNSLSQTGLI